MMKMRMSRKMSSRRKKSPKTKGPKTAVRKTRTTTMTMTMIRWKTKSSFSLQFIIFYVCILIINTEDHIITITIAKATLAQPPQNPVEGESDTL
jgi:hypothetical protein